MALHKVPYRPQSAKIKLWLCYSRGKGIWKKGQGNWKGRRRGKNCSISQQSQEYATSNWSQQCVTVLVVIPTPSCISLHPSHALGTGVVPILPSMACDPRRSWQPKGHWDSITRVHELKPLTFIQDKQGISRNCVCYRGIHISQRQAERLHHH